MFTYSSFPILLLVQLTALLLYLETVRFATGQEKMPKSRKEFLTLCWFWRVSDYAAKEVTTKTFFTIRDSVNFPSKEELSPIREALNTSTEPLILKLGGNVWELRHLEQSDRIRLARRVEGIFGKLEAVSSQRVDVATKWQRSYEMALHRLSGIRSGIDSQKEGAHLDVATFYATSGDGKDREEACLARDDAKANKVYAGISLANDILCICLKGSANGSTDNAPNLCGVATPSSQVWEKNGISTPAAELKKYTDECEASAFPTNLTEENLQAALATFEAKLGTDVSGPTANSEKFRWILGHAKLHSGESGSGACKAGGASATTQGQCVNYGDGSTAKLKPIDWRVAVEGAIEELIAAKAHLNTYKRLAQKTNTLVQNLENVLDEANHTTLKDFNSRKAAEPKILKEDERGTTEKLTSQENSAINVTAISLFILPWLLLV